MATSNTSFHIRFSAPLGEGAGDAASFLVPDHLVTVTYLRVQAGRDATNENADGDDASSGIDPGEFWFNLGLRRPTASGTLSYVTVAGSWSVPASLCTSATENFCRRDVDGTQTIQLNAPQVFQMAESTTFGLPFASAFVLEGRVQEIDPGPSADYTFDYGGAADGTASYSGQSLEKGSFLQAFTQSIDPYRVDVTVQVTVE